MDDLGSAISEFISQPGAMEQVEALAKQLGLDLPSSGPAEAQAASAAAGPALLGPLLQGQGKAPSVTLLEALKPILGPGKQDKLARAIRTLRLISAVRTISGNADLKAMLNQALGAAGM